MIDSAYHEAGHAVIALAFGMPVSSVWVLCDRAAIGRRSGRTQIERNAYFRDGVPIVLTATTPPGPLDVVKRPWSDHQDRLYTLAGDVAGALHVAATPEMGTDPVRESGAHILAIYDAMAEDAFGLVLEETRTLVIRLWPEIEMMAAILATGTPLFNLTPETWREAIA